MDRIYVCRETFMDIMMGVLGRWPIDLFIYGPENIAPSCGVELCAAFHIWRIYMYGAHIRPSTTDTTYHKVLVFYAQCGRLCIYSETHDRNVHLVIHNNLICESFLANVMFCARRRIKSKQLLEWIFGLLFGIYMFIHGNTTLARWLDKQDRISYFNADLYRKIYNLT